MLKPYKYLSTLQILFWSGNFFIIMKILNVKSELGLFWQHPNSQAFGSVSERAFFIRMTTGFNNIDYGASSQQKSLSKDICSMNLIIWLKVIPLIQPEHDTARVNSLRHRFWSHKLKLFPFSPFPSLHFLSSNIQSSKAMQSCYWSEVLSTTHWSSMSLPLEIGAWLLHTKSCLGMWMPFVSQEGVHNIACSFGTWNAEHLSALDVHS